MGKNFYFKSNMNKYWSGIALLIFILFFSDIFIIKEFKNFSFEFFFLLMIPLWIGVLSVNNHETTRIKTILREYLTENYPEKIQEYDAKPVDLLNSDSEDVLDLFADSELIMDSNISFLSKEAKRVTLLMYSVFLGLPVVLVTSVFVFLKS